MPSVQVTGRPWSVTSATGTPKPGGPPMPAWPATDPTHPADWSWPPPTRPPCRRRPPGTWPPTCPTPTHPTPPPARTRRPTSPRSPASTACGRGSSRATSRSRTNSAGPTSKSDPTAPSADTRPWSTAPSPSAGTSGSPHPASWTPPGPTRAPTTGQRGGSAAPHQPQLPCLPRALRTVRSWLTPAVTLNRCGKPGRTRTRPPSSRP